VELTFWVAVLTGSLTAGTALLASWLAGRATIAAAQINVESMADNRRRDHMRELRRSAYVEYIAYTTHLLWRARDAERRAGAGDSTARTQFIENRSGIGNELARLHLVVYLEGSETVQDSASRLRQSFNRLAQDLDTALRLNDPHQIRLVLGESVRIVSSNIDDFLQAARVDLNGVS
jgi:hypothetical protein